MARATPTFVADSMLGRLAKWLRLLGFDTTYDTAWERRGLLRHAREQERILLTRDTRLLRRRELPAHLFVTADDHREQLRQVLAHFQIAAEFRLLTRCSLCNAELEPIDANLTRHRVPPYVFASQRVFRRCPTCDRIYWPATHVERIKAELRTLLPPDPPWH